MAAIGFDVGVLDGSDGSLSGAGSICLNCLLFIPGSPAVKKEQLLPRNFFRAMGRGQKETHPWLFDKNNNRRAQKYTATANRIADQEIGRSGRPAGEPLDEAVGEAYGELVRAVIDETRYRHNEIGILMETIDTHCARAGPLYEAHDAMEHLVTRRLPDCEELLFENAEETNAAAKKLLSLAKDGLQLEALHQERHEDNRAKNAATNKANYEIEIQKLERVKEAIADHEATVRKRLEALEEELDHDSQL